MIDVFLSKSMQSDFGERSYVVVGAERGLQKSVSPSGAIFCATHKRTKHMLDEAERFDNV